MKKITVSFLLLAAITSGVKAQDYKKVREALTLAQVPGNAGQGKLEEAKAQLDKVIADPKAQGNAETYLLKAEVLGSIAGNEALKAKYPTADVEAFQALKKYLELEPTEAKLKEDRYVGVNSIYGSMFSTGVKYYNAKNWDSASTKFKDVAELGDIMTSRKWTTSAFDTTSYLYAGVTAQNAKKNDDAAKYYSKIADHKIGGKDYEGIYDFLTKYYLNGNKQAEFTKYLAIAKELYPTNNIWKDLEFANTTDNASLDDMVKKFQDADAAKTVDAKGYLDYGDFFINNKKIKDLDPSQRAQYTDKAFYAFSKASDLDTANGLSSYNAGVAAYSLFEDASDSARKIKGVTAAIKSKRAAADKQADSAADRSITWLEKSFNTLSSKTNRTVTEKNVVGKTADILYNLYTYQRDRSKVIAPKNYDKYDAKVKFYDSMHGKF